MRHLRSILYALVLAPAAWVLIGVGFTDDLHGRARQYSGVESFTGLLLLLLAGATYAILVFAPISPAGPALFGLVFLGVGCWALISPSSYGDVWPSSVTKPGFDLSRPGYGLAVLLAVPLLCTALSARRWERYEPPQLPLIGVLGRPRGAASVAGTSVAAMTTQVLRPGVDESAAEATQVIRGMPSAGVEPGTEAVPTQALPSSVPSPSVPSPSVPSPSVPSPSVPSPSVPSSSVPSPSVPSSDEPTIVGISDEPTAVGASDEATTDMGGSDEPTTLNVSDETTTAIETTAEVAEAESVTAERPVSGDAAPDDETVDVSAEADDEPAASTEDIAAETPAPEETAEVIEGVNSGRDEPTEAVAADPPTEAVISADSPTDAIIAADSQTDAIIAADSQTDAVTGDLSSDERTEDVAPSDSPADEPAEDITASDSPADEPAEDIAVSDSASDEPAEVVVAGETSVDEPTVVAMNAVETPAEGEHDEPPVAAEPVTVAAEPVTEETAAEKRPVGEKTAAIISADDGEKTQIIRLPVGEMPTRDFNARPGERTQVISRDRLDETQVIRLPQQRTESLDGERTQVIRLGTGTVEPPADRTQVLRLPTHDAPAQPTTTANSQAEQPDRPPSIVGAERPDPGADPTTRLVPPQSSPRDQPADETAVPRDEPGDESTADVDGGKRTMTVMNLERPAGEAADDTRPLRLPPPNGDRST